MEGSGVVVVAPRERGEDDLGDVSLVDDVVAVVVVELKDDGRHHRVAAVPVILEHRIEARIGHDLALWEAVDVFTFGGLDAVGALRGLGQASAGRRHEAALAHALFFVALAGLAERVLAVAVLGTLGRVDALVAGGYALLERAHVRVGAAHVAAGLGCSAALAVDALALAAVLARVATGTVGITGVAGVDIVVVVVVGVRVALGPGARDRSGRHRPRRVGAAFIRATRRQPGHGQQGR